MPKLQQYMKLVYLSLNAELPVTFPTQRQKSNEHIQWWGSRTSALVWNKDGNREVNYHMVMQGKHR